MKKIVFIVSLPAFTHFYAQKSKPQVDFEEPQIICLYPAYTVPAKFPGGIEIFKQKILNQIDGKFLEKAKKNNWATEISFHIEKGGTISHITAAGKNKKLSEKAVEATKRVRGKWIPALKEGNPVIEKYRLLLTINKNLCFLKS